ncbi:MAG: group II intron reverse transcriptase/maturase, partial [Solirubrobacteraceae bacterium]
MAKADPGRRFHALFDKVYRRDVLERAWGLVRANGGAAGIDQTTIQDVERYGVARLLDELAADLRGGRWRALPARRVFIPKSGRSGKLRPLSIPVVRDRIVEAAVRIVIEPIFEADMLECSFGFRPRRSAHDALQVLVDETWNGRRWVAETDIADCFEAIPHSGLMAAVQERISDHHVLRLLRGMLRAGVMTDGTITRSDTGARQGGVLSPCLCNVYLHRLDRQWAERGSGVLVRYGDDLLAMCHSSQDAERALSSLRAMLGELGLPVKEAKTRVMHLKIGGEGLVFLGFEHHWVRSRNPRYRHLTYLVRWPSREKMQYARDRIRELTKRSRLLKSDEYIVRDVNAFLRGFAAYFRYGNSTKKFDQIRQYAIRRLVIVVSKRHKRHRCYGWAQYKADPKHFGLIDLSRAVVPPRPNKPWREQPKPSSSKCNPLSPSGDESESFRP